MVGAISFSGVFIAYGAALFSVKLSSFSLHVGCLPALFWFV
jgi:hypothetical protein